MGPERAWTQTFGVKAVVGLVTAGLLLGGTAACGVFDAPADPPGRHDGSGLQGVRQGPDSDTAATSEDAETTDTLLTMQPGGRHLPRLGRALERGTGGHAGRPAGDPCGLPDSLRPVRDYKPSVYERSVVDSLAGEGTRHGGGPRRGTAAEYPHLAGIAAAESISEAQAAYAGLPEVGKASADVTGLMRFQLGLPGYEG